MDGVPFFVLEIAMNQLNTQSIHIPKSITTYIEYRINVLGDLTGSFSAAGLLLSYMFNSYYPILTLVK